jgi:hypothetical protein
VYLSTYEIERLAKMKHEELLRTSKRRGVLKLHRQRERVKDHRSSALEVLHFFLKRKIPETSS